MLIVGRQPVALVAKIVVQEVAMEIVEVIGG